MVAEQLQGKLTADLAASAAQLEQQRLTAKAQQAAADAQAHEARAHLESVQARLQQTQTTAAVMGAEWRLKHEKLQADTAAAQTKLQARSVSLNTWGTSVYMLTQLHPRQSSGMDVSLSFEGLTEKPVAEAQTAAARLPGARPPLCLLESIHALH